MGSRYGTVGSPTTTSTPPPKYGLTEEDEEYQPLITTKDGAERPKAKGRVMAALFWSHMVVALVVMVVMLFLVDLDHNETLTTPFTVTLFTLSYELPPLYSKSAVCIFLATLVATICAVFFAWMWMLVSRNHPLFLIYLSMAMSPLSTLALAAYTIYQGNLILGGLILHVAFVIVLLFWDWRGRIPYAVELLRTTVMFVQTYPGPVRVAFLSLLPTVFWNYFTSLGVLLAATCIETPMLRYLTMALYIDSSFWTPSVFSGLLRVVSSGVCSMWYMRYSKVDDAGSVWSTLDDDAEAKSKPTRFYVKQALTSSLNAVAVASLVGFDLRTIRASLVTYGKRCCSCCLRGVVWVDKIIPYFNHYSYTQIATHDKSYWDAAKGSWDVLQEVSPVLDDNLLGSILPLSVTMVAVLSLIPGLIVTSLLEDDYYLLAGFLSHAMGSAVMTQVLQVLDSAVVTIIQCFAEHPDNLERINPLLHARFKSLCYPQSHEDDEELAKPEAKNLKADAPPHRPML